MEWTRSYEMLKARWKPHELKNLLSTYFASLCGRYGNID
jgi:hypothetical protein